MFLTVRCVFEVISMLRWFGFLQAAVVKLNYNPDDAPDQLIAKKNDLSVKSRRLRERIDIFCARRPFTAFSYNDPERDFNRRLVHGPVCRLIKLKNPNEAFAVEIAGGGRLYEVVVEDENVSKKLIKNGDLQRRTTFIPMNKLKANPISVEVVRAAQKLVGAENVRPAMELVEFNPKFKKVMEYVLGNVLICKDFATARKVAFDERVKKRCVTLEGDAVDPAGVFEGGAAPAEGSVLAGLEEIVQFEVGVLICVVRVHIKKAMLF